MFNEQEYRDTFFHVTASPEAYRRVLRMAKRKHRDYMHRRTAILIAAIIAMMGLSVTAFASEFIQNWFVSFFAEKNDSALTQEQVNYIEENAQNINEVQMQDNWNVELKSAITDGDVAYIVIGVTAPEGVSLEQRVVDGSILDRFNPGNLFPIPEDGQKDVITCSEGIASVSGNYQYVQSFTMVEDGDGLPNTKNWVFTLEFCKFDAGKETTITEPFGSDIEWYIHIEDIIREYEDEEYRQELMNGKYAGQTDVMFTHEETKRLQCEEILAEGTWDFTVNFGESGEGVELLNQPITTMASIFRKTGPEIWDYEHVVDKVTVTSFVLRPLSATIHYECDGGANFNDHKEMRVYAVMKDGGQVELADYGGGGRGFAVLTAKAPIIVENVDYILLADGVRIDMP